MIQNPPNMCDFGDVLGVANRLQNFVEQETAEVVKSSAKQRWCTLW